MCLGPNWGREGSSSKRQVQAYSNLAKSYSATAPIHFATRQHAAQEYLIPVPDLLPFPYSGTSNSILQWIRYLLPVSLGLSSSLAHQNRHVPGRENSTAAIRA